MGGYYDRSPHLARSLRARLGDIAKLEPRLSAFGETVAEVIDPLVYELERQGPALAPGEQVRFHPGYAQVGRAVWASGIVGAPPFEQAALFYLLAHAGEAGHACPIACTAGLVRALRRHGSEELRERFLPPLLLTDYDRAQRGAQFLTEEHGGSDVGANLTRAVETGEGWRIHGEKWFCSVADADQFVVTARPEGAPEGTRGLGCFLVPRLLDGQPNGFTIRKLKDKLGTRALATGEIVFEGALAFPIGPLEEGFRIAVGVVLNTSRWLNALGSAALMHRAFLVASEFAAERVAFGRPIVEYPLVRENLAVMKAEEEAALASTLELTSLVESHDPDDVAYHRILVNANKLSTSLAATRVVRRAIEVLGGNGTIEDFSPLPRLWRDAIVFESWEGTHNVLSLQVVRDLVRYGSLELVLDRPRGVDVRIDRALGELGAGLRDPDPLYVRRRVERLVRAIQASCLLREGAVHTAELIVRRHLTPGWRAEDDRGYRDLLERVLSETPAEAPAVPPL